MRTFEEMAEAAMLLRRKLLQEQKDPTAGVFHVTQEEECVLKDRTPFMHPMLNDTRNRLCGLEVKII